MVMNYIAVLYYCSSVMQIIHLLRCLGYQKSQVVLLHIDIEGVHCDVDN